MATIEFKILEAKAFWTISQELRRAMRERATQAEIELLAAKVGKHARFGVQPGIRCRAEALVVEARPAIRFG